MQTSATNKKLRTLLTGIRDKTLIPNPHFQRRLVWSNAHKLAFLSTVLDGLPFPEIFISAGEVNPNTGDGTELIVDGQQRMTTLHQYFTASEELRLSPGGIVPYRDLEDREKVRFLEYEVVVRDLGPLTEDETRDIFQRINSTKYSLNAMEVNSSRFDGELKRFAERLAGKKFFEDHKVFSGLDGRRMNDVRFALTMVITALSGYFNRDDEHESYLERYNDSFPDANRLESEIVAVLRFIEDCDFDDRSRVWQKADLFTLFAELYRLLMIDKMKLDPRIVGRTLADFYDEVESVTRSPDPRPDAAEYFRRMRAGINDRMSRINRGLVVRGRITDASLLDLDPGALLPRPRP
ncbi:DUF262 domain-containing protein [Micromonospora sp. RP3T]|uniref:GmrSD restriction endonuclease domain-containing protein n=1 Tax=Micromonospora sp. RP3T TaxID=2135446 RepID=UPI000D169B77|nr:DUF262 domain-containing protein [Micromonospora sp. RP3T]PTA47965.1 DUF262 domain-containing protein [Micromonospora sp. RP3T]